MKKIIIFGAGGHANSCIDVILEEKKFKINFIVDDNKVKIKKFNFNVKSLKFFQKNYKKNDNLFLGVGLIKNAVKRWKLIKKLQKYNLNFVKIISPHSHVSKHSKILEGTVVMHNSVINSNTLVKEFSIINTSSIIEHDVLIGKNCHISTGAIVNGGTKIGDHTFIGSGTIVHNGIEIGSNCIIGAGKIIKRNLPSNCVVK